MSQSERSATPLAQRRREADAIYQYLRIIAQEKKDLKS